MPGDNSTPFIRNSNSAPESIEVVVLRLGSGTTNCCQELSTGHYQVPCDYLPSSIKLEKNRARVAAVDEKRLLFPLSLDRYHPSSFGVISVCLRRRTRCRFSLPMTPLFHNL